MSDLEGTDGGTGGSSGTRDYSAMFDLTGRSALVIGAGGIEAEVAAAVAAHGAG